MSDWLNDIHDQSIDEAVSAWIEERRKRLRGEGERNDTTTESDETGRESS